MNERIKEEIRNRVSQGLAPLRVEFERWPYGDPLQVEVSDPETGEALHRFAIPASEYQRADLLANRLRNEQSRFVDQVWAEMLPDE